MHPLSRGARSPLRGDESKGRVPLVLVEILQKNVRRRSPGGRRGGRSLGPSWPILTGREKLRARRLCEVLSLRRSGRHPLRPRGGAPGRAGRQTGASHHFKRAFKGRMTRADSDRWCTTPGRLAREAGGRGRSSSWSRHSRRHHRASLARRACRRRLLRLPKGSPPPVAEDVKIP